MPPGKDGLVIKTLAGHTARGDIPSEEIMCTTIKMVDDSVEPVLSGHSKAGCHD
jgi:hypothetical protein